MHTRLGSKSVYQGFKVGKKLRNSGIHRCGASTQLRALVEFILEQVSNKELANSYTNSSIQTDRFIFYS